MIKAEKKSLKGNLLVIFYSWTIS